jgi:hypothetical protein
MDKNVKNLNFSNWKSATVRARKHVAIYLYVTQYLLLAGIYSVTQACMQEPTLSKS